MTTDLSRVGTQKPPSALNLRGVRCLVSDGTKWAEVYFDPSADAAGWLTSDETKGKRQVKNLTVLISDHTVQNAYRKVREWLSANDQVQTKESIERMLEEDVRTRLRGASAILPDKNDEDATLYPLSEHAESAIRKSLAVVHHVKPASPYAHIKDESRVSDSHSAAIVFKLEEL